MQAMQSWSRSGPKPSKNPQNGKRAALSAVRLARVRRKPMLRNLFAISHRGRCIFHSNCFANALALLQLPRLRLPQLRKLLHLVERSAWRTFPALNRRPARLCADKKRSGSRERSLTSRWLLMQIAGLRVLVVRFG